jgi:dihydroxyacetone kinase-like protein
MTADAAALESIGRALVAARDRLNEADSAAGDGDLGITVEAIGQTLIELAAELAALAPESALRRFGLEIGGRAPSTFGTLLSMGLIGASRSAAVPHEPSVETAGRLVRAVETTISTRGKTQRGDKTLLDALGPAADALEAAATAGSRLPSALADAARAAAAGAEATRALEPTVGRQAWLADRARGSIDPGALAISIAAAAASEAAGSGA